VCEKKLIEIIETSKSKNEILLKYFGFSNARVYEELNEFILENDINVSHFNKKIKYCLNCNKKINSRNKFCNSSCAATFNNKKRKLSNETKNKISDSLLNNRFINNKVNRETKKICVICKNEFISQKCLSGKPSKSKCCSKECHLKLKSNNTKDFINKRIANGIHKGWTARNIISYPERFFINVLKNNNIGYKHNYPVNKRNLGLTDSCNYFLDFYIEDKNIDLEIDGKQHNYRKEHDVIRDKILNDNGYVVYRIKWKNINTENGKQYIKNEINKFLEYYNNI